MRVKSGGGKSDGGDQVEGRGSRQRPDMGGLHESSSVTGQQREAWREGLTREGGLARELDMSAN